MNIIIIIFKRHTDKFIEYVIVNITLVMKRTRSDNATYKRKLCYENLNLPDSQFILKSQGTRNMKYPLNKNQIYISVYIE